MSHIPPMLERLSDFDASTSAASVGEMSEEQANRTKNRHTKMNHPYLGHINHPSSFSLSWYQMTKAIRALPLAQREALDEVLQKDPNLVQLESPPQRYLHALVRQKDGILDSSSIASEVADKITLYWKIRKETFGDRFACPLRLDAGDADEKGNFITALDPETIQELRSGAYMLVPPETSGPCSLPVLLIDQANQSKRTTRLVQTQVYFYLFQALLSWSFYEFVGICQLQDGVKNDSLGEGFKRLSGILPLQPSAIHILTMRQPMHPDQVSMTNVGASREWKLYDGSLQFVSHIYGSQTEAQNDLRRYGFSRGHVTQRFGGVANGASWCQDRVAEEQKNFAYLDDVLISSAHMEDKGEPITVSTALDEPANAGLKRMASELLDPESEQCEGRKKARIEKQNVGLEKQEHLLEAQLHCAQFILNQYQRDRGRIRAFVATVIGGFVASSTLKDAEECRDASKHALLADVLLNEYLIFQGRKPGTGQWVFDITNRPLSHGVRMELSRLRVELLKLQKSIDTGNCRSKSTSEEIDFDKEGGKSSSAEKDVNSNVDEDIRNLQMQVKMLQDQNKEMKESEGFLQSLLVCANHSAEQHEQDIKAVRAELLLSLSTCFSVSDISLQGSSSLERLVDHLLDYRYVVFLGHDVSTGRPKYEFASSFWEQMRIVHMKQEMDRLQKRNEEHMLGQSWSQVQADSRVSLNKSI